LILRLTLTYLFLFSSLFCFSQLFTFRNYNHKNGLKLTSVLSINQDEKGFIWLGTDGAGIQKFDGYSITNPFLNPNENEHHVTYIEPKNDAIYFSSRYQGFFKFNQQNVIEKIELDYDDIGEKIGIKKINEHFIFIGSTKIKIVSPKNKKIDEIKLKSPHFIIKQIHNFKQLIVLIGEIESYIITENKIYEINEFINSKKEILFDFTSNNDEKLFLYSRANNLKLSLSFFADESIKSIQTSYFLLPKIKKIKTVAARNNQMILIDTLDNLYYYRDNKIKYLPKNFKSNNYQLNSVFIDENENYWGVSSNSGLFKIALEPFTKIDLHPVYQNPLISFIYKTQYNEVVLSDHRNQTYIGDFKSDNFKVYPFRIYSQTIHNKKQLFATNNGVYIFENNQFKLFENLKEKTIFIKSINNVLFYCIEGKGLFKLVENDITSYIGKSNKSHIYSSEVNHDNTKIYFATNDGILEYNFKNNVLKDFSIIKKLKGSFSGLSTKDVYGTIWFTIDKTLVAITKKGKIKQYSDKQIFRSTLFYTLNADKFGNLWIGTNECVTKIKIDENATIINSIIFDKTNGFDGYETHMRSSYDDGKLIFIGTIEGLFVINPLVYEKPLTPPKPYIYQTLIKNSKESVYDQDLIKINFLSINPKFLGVKYSYRLKGKNNKWSKASSETSAYFANLTDQTYIFEVKATFDDKNFSPISSFEINIKTPFWRSTWFILCVILAISISNLVVLDKSKSFKLRSSINYEGTEISQKIQLNILLFGFITTTSCNFFATKLDKTIPDFFYLNSLLLFVFITLVLVSVLKLKIYFLQEFKLNIAFYAVIFHAIIGLYFSNIHPYYVVVICLTASLAHVILTTKNQIIVYAVLQLIIACSFVFLFDKSIYNEFLFVISIFVSVSITIFNAYIKNEAIQKLLFISSIVDKGNFLALAFNNEHKITYVSDSFYNLVMPKKYSLIGFPLNDISQFIYTEIYRNKNIAGELLKNKTLILPIKSKKNKLFWIEWKVFHFSKNSYVVLGQNVSKRVEFKNQLNLIDSNTDDLIYSVDLKGNLINYNQKFKEIFIQNESSELLINTFNFIANEDKEKTIEFYENQFKSKTILTKNTFKTIDKNQKIRILNQTTTLLYEDNSTKFIKGFYCVASDLTEFHETENKINFLTNIHTKNLNEIKNIQDSLLAYDYLIDTNRFHIIHKAKNIFSNDFHQIKNIDSKKIIAVGSNDSNGTDGAIINLFCSSFLTELIENKNIHSPGQLLNELDKKIKTQFENYFENLRKFCFEITIISIDDTTKQITYASSGGMFFSITENDVIVHRGESKRINELPNSSFSKYNDYELIYDKINSIVLFSEGIIKLTHEEQNKTFTLKRLLDFFKSKKEMQLSQNFIKLEAYIDEWNSTTSQSHDVTIIGLKL
jgi:PAS domain S-box-containing protein